MARNCIFNGKISIEGNNVDFKLVDVLQEVL
jgi:hypothetical protein